MDLSIVIVNWNTAAFLRGCLQSIYKTTKKVDFEIFVVDNASTDESVEMLKEEFPRVKLIANKKNLGFPKANNQTIRMAQGEYILLLNPDTIVEENTIDKCVEYLKGRLNVGALGVRIYNADGAVDFTCVRRLPTPFRFFWEASLLSKIFLRRDYWAYNDSREVECISGAFMMVPKRVFNGIGLLDEEQFMYAEDVDLCFRIKNSGLKVYYLADHSIIHFGEGSSKQISIKSFLQGYESRKYIFKKYYGQKAITQLKLFTFFNASLKIFVILMGIPVLMLLRRRNRDFSVLNLKKYLSLLKLVLRNQE